MEIHIFGQSGSKNHTQRLTTYSTCFRRLRKPQFGDDITAPLVFTDGSAFEGIDVLPCSVSYPHVRVQAGGPHWPEVRKQRQHSEWLESPWHQDAWRAEGEGDSSDSTDRSVAWDRSSEEGEEEGEKEDGGE